MVFLGIYGLFLYLSFLFRHFLSSLDIALDVIIRKQGTFGRMTRIDILSEDEFGNECIFLLFFEVLLDHLRHITMLLLLYGMHHLILEILLSFLLTKGSSLTVLNPIVMVDILIHLNDLILEPDHQVVQKLSHVEKDPISLNFGIDEYVLKLDLRLLEESVHGGEDIVRLLFLGLDGKGILTPGLRSLPLLYLLADIVGLQVLLQCQPVIIPLVHTSLQVIQQSAQVISAGWQPATEIYQRSSAYYASFHGHITIYRTLQQKTMGVRSSNIQDHDLDKSPVYCIGCPSDIHFSSDDESTNQYLIKLKSGAPEKMFKCRVKSKKILNYFCLNASIITFVEPLFRNGPRLGIVSMSREKSVRIHQIASIIKKELKVEEKEALYIYQNFKLMKEYQRLAAKDQDRSGGLHVFNLKYSKLQILG